MIARVGWYTRIGPSNPRFYPSASIITIPARSRCAIDGRIAIVTISASLPCTRTG